MIRLLRFALLLLLGGAFAQAAIPRITDYAPFRGAPGTVFTIVGQNFTVPLEVYIGNTKAAAQVLSANQIQAIVPAGALSGLVTVKTAGGIGNSQQLAVPYFLVAPRIEVFYRQVDQFGEPVLPATAIVGDQITVRGANFDNPNNPANPGGGLGVFVNGVRVTAGSLNGSGQIQIFAPVGSRTGPITVTNFAGSVTSSQLLYFQPVISSFTPRARSGDTVDVYGINFTAATEVRFGAAPAAFTVLSGTNLQAVVPTNAVTGKLTLTAPGGSYITTSNFLVAPRITGFSPGGGPAGTVVTLDGTALGGTTSVKFGNATADKVTNVSQFKVTAVVPAAATSGPITLVTASGTNVSATPFFLPPSVTAFTPTQGGPGTVVKLTGKEFLGATKVELGAVSLPEFTVDSATQISVTVPAGAVTGFFKVTTPGGADESATTFRVLGDEPVIAGFTPQFGPAGTQVTIRGSNLATATNVAFNGTKATFAVSQGTNLVATVPAGATTGLITVASAAGSSNSSTEFTVGSTTDLRLTLTPSENPPVAFGPLAYTVRVVNQGVLPATNTIVRVTLPATATYFDATFTRPFELLVGNVLEVTAGTLKPEDILTGLIRVNVGAPGDFTAKASVTNGVPDATPVNNGIILIQAAQAPELSLEPQLGMLLLSWSAAGTNYVAEQQAGLGLPSWLPVPGEPESDGGTLQLAVPAPETNRFYRVRLRDGL